jgi:hypothetical protein
VIEIMVGGVEARLIDQPLRANTFLLPYLRSLGNDNLSLRSGKDTLGGEVDLAVADYHRGCSLSGVHDDTHYLIVYERSSKATIADNSGFELIQKTFLFPARADIKKAKHPFLKANGVKRISQRRILLRLNKDC